jgi:hypothetical protein
VIPVWLLDLDGVVNATRPGWGGPPRRGVVYAESQEWRIRWAPALVDRIRALVVAGAVEVRWCTTWCAWTDQFERMWRLPELPRTFTEPINGRAAAEAKLAAARKVLADGRRLIWTDDDEVPLFGPLYDELAAGGRGLLIRPASNRGLQPEHMDLIEAFCALTAEEAMCPTTRRSPKR